MPFISSVRGNFGPQGKLGRRLSLTGSTGGAITTAGGYTIHTFTTAGNSTFVAAGAGDVEYLVIAGGGAGGASYGGGGGAGGYRTATGLAVTPGNIPVTVGMVVVVSLMLIEEIMVQTRCFQQ
jgi:hypothetical protein